MEQRLCRLLPGPSYKSVKQQMIYVPWVRNHFTKLKSSKAESFPFLFSFPDRFTSLGGYEASEQYFHLRREDLRWTCSDLPLRYRQRPTS